MLDEELNEFFTYQYYEFLQDMQLRDINILTELPEDYENEIITLNPKRVCVD